MNMEEEKKENAKCILFSSLFQNVTDVGKLDRKHAALITSA